MLLVGQSHRTKALAADLLRITGDGKPQRSQQHNNPAMTTLKDSAGKFIFTPLQDVQVFSPSSVLLLVHRNLAQFPAVSRRIQTTMTVVIPT